MDWNNDGNKDLIAGDTKGNVTLFLNIGTEKEPKLAKGKLVEADGKPISPKSTTYKTVSKTYMGVVTYKRPVVDKTIPASHKLAQRNSRIHVADWDGDGLKDLLVGHGHTVILYKNVGSQSAPRLEAPVLIEITEGNFPCQVSPYVVDWDGDGRKDLMVGSDGPMVVLYLNIGTDKKPKLAKGEVLDLKRSGSDRNHAWRLEVTDWNNDGKKDLLVGNRWYDAKRGSGGHIWLFLGK